MVISYTIPMDPVIPSREVFWGMMTGGLPYLLLYDPEGIQPYRRQYLFGVWLWALSTWEEGLGSIGDLISILYWLIHYIIFHYIYIWDMNGYKLGQSNWLTQKFYGQIRSSNLKKTKTSKKCMALSPFRNRNSCLATNIPTTILSILCWGNWYLSMDCHGMPPLPSGKLT